ncbi:hypothetical protein CBR_g12930 [Chara braunii]|uniref:Uncharacterized protein n=1 Tax=Chara braunii TaxID=69332 RepID=A0A388KTF2_CHABU|nr:hypothetical protein CBR_g12930 [Chara braunii]|eukprot:GBG73213.1 hypothetical protein CBR_g12930 [Chara braunii]
MPETNLCDKLDEVAKGSVRKSAKEKELAEQGPAANKREAFVVDNKRQLRGLKKEEVLAICSKEGITYATLDRAKEDIVSKKTALAFGEEGSVDVPDESISSADLVKTGDGETVS